MYLFAKTFENHIGKKGSFSRYKLYTNVHVFPFFFGKLDQECIYSSVPNCRGGWE